ncbi:hypothetical protein ACFYU4_37815 [Streptomyces tendae]|uniref:hypothetical protein n=1 Tax=Streptomyces tendae TaxID=1932 RepID=UPI0036A06C37
MTPGSSKALEYRRNLRAWWVLMAWWMVCLAAVLAIIWAPADVMQDANVATRVLFTVFGLLGYTLAIFLPMAIARPVPPEPNQGNGRSS